jgi:zona occludens toxin (predicted ATPase)
VYRQAEAKQALINGVAITLLLGALVSMLGGLFYFILKAKGMI